ncbi:MAG TPA: DUF1302 family protein [Polyangiaceae bacterium]
MKLKSVLRVIGVIGVFACTSASAAAQEDEDRIEDPELRGVPLARERAAQQQPSAPPPDTAPQPAAPAPNVAAETTEDDDFLQMEQRIRDPEIDAAPLRSELPPPPPDPEATVTETAPSGGAESEGGGDDGATVIEDPELAGKEVTKESDADLRTTFQLELHTRLGLDTNWETENDRERVIEGTQIANLDINFRRSEKLRFAVGLRGRYRFMRMRSDPPGDERAESFELDVAPTAGYADATVADGVHLRLGYQTISLGRFDFFTGVNFLGVSDLRDGPATMPGASEIAQLALRLDFDLTSWLTLQAFYVPFFTPHLVSVYGSDYSILSLLDQDPAGRDLADAIGRETLANLSESAYSALSPEPDLTKQQAALRLTGRSGALEVALTVGIAREHTPAVEVKPQRLELLFRRLAEQELTEEEEAESRKLPFELRYNRYYILSVDAATGIGPVQLGFEATYLKDLTAYAQKPAEPPPTPGVRGDPGLQIEQADVTHFGLRAEWVEADIQTAAEMFYRRVLDDPSDSSARWGGFEDGRWLAGAGAGLRFTPGGGKFSVDAAALGLVGPSVIFSPRLEYALAANLWIEFGAIIVEGRRGATFADPNTTVGGIYDGTDQVFTGVRWMP